MSAHLQKEALLGLDELLEAFRACPDSTDESLRNLRHYLTLRSADRRELQEKLFLLGLSSLGRSFAHIEASVANIHSMLSRAMGQAGSGDHQERIIAAREAIEKRRAALLGGIDRSLTGTSTTRVMVTLPFDAAENGGELIKALAGAGVHIFRINAAHDSPPVWQAMASVIERINRDRDQTDKLRIYVDLCGPKIRTGEIKHQVSPIRVGSNKSPQPLYLCGPKNESRPQGKVAKTAEVIAAQLAVDSDFLKACYAGARIKVRDINGKKGLLELIEPSGEGWLCQVNTRLLLGPESQLHLKGVKVKSPLHRLQAQPEVIRLFKGDRFYVSGDGQSGHAARYDESGGIKAYASIGCTHQEAIGYVKCGDRVYIDDGKLGAEVEDVLSGQLLCRVIHAKPTGTVIKAQKGINLPDTALPIAAMSEADRAALKAVAGYADMIGLSFAQSGEDVAELGRQLNDLGCKETGIVAKIETQKGVRALPEILEALIGADRPAGVMIARGDLAIEMGFENLAWLQEEILDICTAAHLPVIWATQVLESQMKSNLPSRAEVTDAAMGSRAECVMLNKGAFAVDTIRVLGSILGRFHELYAKNRQLLSHNTLWL
jgi:pyruvate kinase